jgi:hypothetical protein
MLVASAFATVLAADRYTALQAATSSAHVGNSSSSFGAETADVPG